MNRGSEWRRWELHIHTPQTKKNDNFNGDTIEEQWSRFYSDIKDYIGNGENIDKAIAALGVTDYLSIENYLKIKQDGIITNTIPFIFPNVELRVQPSGKSPINMHILFNPEIDLQIDQIFFSKLKFDYNGNEYSATKSDLIRLGKSIDNSFDDIKAEKEGREHFVIDFKTLKELYKDNKILQDNTLIGVANRSEDGASSLQDDQYKLIRNDIYRFSNFIFSSIDRDIKYFLGLGCDNEDALKNKIGGKKPCVHGSDAHTNENIFEPDCKRYCWIKAEATFDGLKQIMYEPDSRVYIGEIRPDTKLNYHTIDYVVFNDENFSKDRIYFNENLNCIIGGKSTGKSLLLNSMANAIDTLQVNDKFKYLNKEKFIIDNIKVVWKDNTISSKDNSNSKKIVYIPQTYLNRLSDESEEQTEIDAMIMDVILQDDELDAKYEAFNKGLKDDKIELDKLIYDLITETNQNKQIKDKKLEFGTFKSIESNLLLLRKKKEEISKTCSLSEEDLTAYENALTQNNNIIKEIDKLKNLKNDLLLLDSLFLKKEIEIENEQILMAIQEEQLQELGSANTTWLSKREIIVKGIEKEIAKFMDDFHKNEKIIQKIKPNIESSEALNKLTNQIKDEEQKLYELKLLDKQQKLILQKIESLKMNISNKVAMFDQKHIALANEFNIEANKNLEDLEFIVKTPFRLKALITNIQKICNNKKLKLILTSFEDICAEDCDQKFFLNVLNVILNNDENGILKKEYKIEDALRIIMSDWYNTTFTIKLDEDEISNMSPGKKAIVLLRLLLNLKESSCPILIDQPEDDLDNRSIFKDLVRYVRKKKSDRQIIVVTHNANIVLGCDAEEIIIANQQGIDSKNENYRFEYRCGALEDMRPIRDHNNKIKKGILNETGMQQHICSILEGGKEAFNLRKHKYNTDQYI